MHYLTAPANNQRAVRKGGSLVIEQKAKVRNRQEGSTPKRKAGGSAPVSNKRMSEKEQALRSNVADNPSASAKKKVTVKVAFFSEVLNDINNQFVIGWFLRSKSVLASIFCNFPTSFNIGNDF